MRAYIGLEPAMRALFLAGAMTLSLSVPGNASNLTGEALALACAGNVPGLKKEKDTEQYARFCNAYINGWDDARFAFLQGARTYCPPGLTVKEMSAVFFDYLASHKVAALMRQADRPEETDSRISERQTV